MSKGLGRVQRAVLDVLEGGPLDGPTLALHAMTSPESTRRALRTLHAARLVAFVGKKGRGGRDVWCLPEDLEDVRAYQFSEESISRIAALMGGRFARSVRRAFNVLI